MITTVRTLVLFIIIAVLGFSCSALKEGRSQTINRLRFIGEFDLPHRLQFQGTTVGGLSSIDYVASEDLYYLICDDRSDINPARFYTAKIQLGEKGIDTVQLLAVTTLLQKNGEPYPNKKQDSLHVPDPEALRYNAAASSLVWSSEGERIVRKDKVILTNPAIYIGDRSGQVTDSLPLPPNMHMTATEKGPRQNGVFEGLAFADNNKTLFVSVEEPLYEDGPRAGLKDTSGWIRIIRYDMTTRQPVAQYAYLVDPVVQEPISRGAFIV
ncbi:MAG TPA: esterase-like activity of phytase family protein, partial [Flavisolibacter sp.]|nr:esterase-like activity of phytase family protein [Flavisolibacter sp.]